MSETTSTFCTHHRETVGDDSPRDEVYPDDRTVLAHVYDGLSLRAVCHDEREVERYRQTSLTVVLTPAGECRIEGRCCDVRSTDTHDESLLAATLARLKAVVGVGGGPRE